MNNDPYDQDICAICSELFVDINNDPLTLQCKHKFCDTCLQRWIASKINQDDIDSFNFHNIKIKCPICKQTTLISHKSSFDNNVNKFTINKYISYSYRKPLLHNDTFLVFLTFYSLLHFSIVLCSSKK